MRVVLDASAIAKWFLREEESEEMRKLLSGIVSGMLEAHVPSLAFVELANLLRYARGLTEEDVVKGVSAAMAIGLVKHEFEEVYDRAIRLAFEKKLTVYDAVYAALAEILDSYLITYDEQLLRVFPRAVRAGQLVR